MKDAEILRPAKGIEIIDVITDQFGVDTLEGRVGPLLQGEELQAVYLDMPAGLYCEEHPHPHESMRYCQMLWMKVVRPLGVMGPWKRAYPGDPWV